MKLKITEEQLKFIIENEIPDDNIMEINMEDYESIHGLGAKLIKILRDCKLKKCNKIKIVGDLDLSRFNDNPDLLQTFCNKLYKVEGNLDLYNSPITKLPMLSEVGGYLYLYKTPITELPMLSTVGGYLDLSETSITELPMLSTVRGELNLYETSITKLQMLYTVGGNLILRFTPITELPMLSKVGGDLVLLDTPLGEELNKTMSDKEVKNKFGVKGDLYI